MPISEAVIENQAKNVREKLGIGRVASPDIYWVLEKLTSSTQNFNFRPELSSRMNGDEAIMNADTHTLTVQETVLESARAGQVRARFTIAHEMGHYFLNHSGDRRRNPDKNIYVSSKERIEEEEANIFASYFLVPTDLALGCQTSEEIACKFQVSNRAAEIAFERVERVRRKLSGKGRELPPSVVDFLQEAKRRGHPVKTTISD